MSKGISKSNRKRKLREEPDDEAAALYKEGQQALRSIASNASLKDALSRSLTTHMMGAEGSQSGVGGLPAGGGVSPTPPLSPFSLPTSASATGGPSFPSHLAAMPRRQEANSNSMLDITNRFMNSLEQKKTSRINAVFQRHASDSLLAQHEAEKEARGEARSTTAPQPFETELHIENEEALVLPLEPPTAPGVGGDTTTAKEKGPAEGEEKANKGREDDEGREDSDSEGEGEDSSDSDVDSLEEELIEAQYEGKRKKHTGEAKTALVGSNAAGSASSTDSGRSDGEDEDEEEQELQRQKTEQIRRRHQMERLQRTFSTGTGPHGTATVGSTCSSPIQVDPTVGPAGSASLISRSGPAAAAGGAGGVGAFKDAATRRREALSKQTSMGLFANVSAESAQILQRSNTFDNSVTAPVVFDQQQRTKKAGEESQDVAAGKKKKSVGLVSKVSKS